ncbi:MAG: type II secretion system F family protein, partial [Candidatus Sumerlaeota bacterium]
KDEKSASTPEPSSNTPGKPETSGSGMQRQMSLGNPGLAQMTAFCRQLATLVEVGIPLVQCLNTLANRLEHPKLKKTVASVAQSVEAGNSFSEALAEHPDVFSPLVVNVVRIGETGGILESALRYLAEIMERRYEIRRRVAGALAYPVAALIVCGVVILIILGLAIPAFQEAYADLTKEGTELPGITRFVMDLSDFVQSWWWLIIILVVAAFLAFRFAIRTNTNLKKQWDYLCLKRIPIVSGLTVKVNVSRVSQTLANLLKAGIPLLEALRITSETSENSVVAEMLMNVHDHIEKGGQIDKPLRDADIFPALVVDMVAIGDEANRLDTMFDKIAEVYEADVNHSIQTMNAIIEPALIIVMGTVVLLLALSVLLPMWELARGFDT